MAPLKRALALKNRAPLRQVQGILQGCTQFQD